MGTELGRGLFYSHHLGTRLQLTGSQAMRRGAPEKGENRKSVTLRVRLDAELWRFVKLNGGSAFVRGLIERDMRTYRTIPVMNNVTAPTDAFPYPTLAIDGQKIADLTKSLEDAQISYGLGSKIEPLSLQGPDLLGAGISSVDCSGFVRWAIFHALGQPEDFNFQDGSAQQHEQVQAVGFKPSTYDDALVTDGHVRIGFLTPEDGGGVGHVVLIWDGNTYESHGGKGPDSRIWGSCGWMAKMFVFVLV